MTGYPEDVMESAQSAYDALESITERDRDTPRAAADVAVIARAILAERERCAKIADEWMPIEKLLPLCGADMNEAAVTGQVEAGERIAAAIRGGSNA